MPTMTTPCSASLLSRGRSFLQGPHHVAQKCNRYGLPDTSGGGPPIQPFAGSAGAGLPTIAAIGATSRLINRLAFEPLGVLDLGPLADLVVAGRGAVLGVDRNQEPLVLHRVAFLRLQLGEPIGEVSIRPHFLDAEFRAPEHCFFSPPCRRSEGRRGSLGTESRSRRDLAVVVESDEFVRALAFELPDGRAVRVDQARWICDQLVVRGLG